MTGSATVHPMEEKEDKKVNQDEDRKKIYSLVDMHGSGSLVKLMRAARSTGNYEELTYEIENNLKDYLYNQGKGKVVPISELVKIRNKERNAKLNAFARKKGKGKTGPNVLDDIDQDNENAGDLQKALKLLDGGGKGGRGESKYRELCWKIEHRGTMGETLLGVCLLHGTNIHNLLAIRIIDAFPKLVNDISISEDYYGHSPLHQAIVNQDCEMVSKLLRKGADVNQRCYGAFFCAEDQKASRTDSMEHEYVELTKNSNYTGMYFGEYPLSFAVCMDQPDILRLLIAKKANLNAQDTNGNTVLHLCVIHGKLDMMKHCLEAGAKLGVLNKQNLTPLTLAAMLAKKKIFDFILELQCERVWTYGEAACTGFPLTKIDTINESTGEMNEESALALVVYGESQCHLEFFDGLIENILQEKWKAYGKNRWLLSLVFFIVYYILFTSAFMLRPFSATTEHITQGAVSRLGVVKESTEDEISFNNASYSWAPSHSQCHLMEYGKWSNGWIRLCCEILVIVCIIFQILLDVRDIKQIGRKKWLEVMRAFPAKMLYKLSWFIVLLCVPVRLSCGVHPSLLYMENFLATVAVVLTTLHFLYFLRAIPFVGPFVLMVYSIIATDLSRFFVIYSIFLIGFSQSFYMMFTTCEREAKERAAAGLFTEFENIMQHPIDALLRTFIMTIGEFGVLYREMSACDAVMMRNIGKVMFLVFEIFVSILQFNLLIAMMTRTYETIFLTRKEWKRQWAQVILMLEMSLSPHERLLHLLKYSRPTGTNKKLRSYVVKNRGMFERNEEEELKLREEKAEKIREERKALLKRRQKEQEQRVQALRVIERLVVRKSRSLLRQHTVQ